MKTGIQQIMLGTLCKDETSALNTLNRIAKAGYEGIELNRFMIHPSSLPIRLLTRAAGMPTGNGGKLDWHHLISQSGLEVISLHTDLGSLENNTEEVIEEAKSFHTPYVVITGMYRFDYTSETEVRNLARRLNTQGKVLKENGLFLLYHNHNAELVRVNKEKRAYDILIEETDADFVNFEFDSFWFAQSGADPAYWMRKLGKRMKLWHINDCGSRVKKKIITPILKCDSMELGTGNMNLATLKEIALEAGIEAAVLESHRNWIDNDPLASMELSAVWLKENFG